MAKVTLFEFLNKPAGGELGKAVNKAAQEQKIPFEQKEIDTPKYKGKVFVYPKMFLTKYFKENPLPQQ